MFSHQVWFLVYVQCDGGKVYLSDDSHLSIVGCGRVLIIFLDGKVKMINGVMHILSLAWNLLLVNTLNDVGVQVVFYNGW
jgi:hypothetical protein